VCEEGRPLPELERVQRLRQVIQQAAQRFLNAPRDEKYFRVLDKTFFHPAPTQEAAAELLDLPFSTYRRYLKNAVERLAAQLWLEEVGR
jgi:hypothetical protein